MKLRVISASAAVIVGMSSIFTLSASGSPDRHASVHKAKKLIQITIGADAPLTGSLASIAPLALGASAYFDSIDASGGVNGYKFKYIVLDSQGEPAIALSDARELVEEDHILAYVSGVGTPEQLVVSPYLRSQGIPNVAPEAEPESSLLNHWTFTVVEPSTADGAFQAEYAIKTLTKSNTIGILYSNDTTGTPYLYPFRYETALAGDTLVEQAFTAGTTDLTPQIDALKAAGADVVFISGEAENILPAMQAAESLNYYPKWETISGDTSPTLFASLPPQELANLYYATDAPVPGTASTAPIEAALKKYEPSVPFANDAIVSWINASIFVAGFRKMTEDGHKPTAKALTAALSTFKNYGNAWIKGITFVAPKANPDQHMSQANEAMISVSSSGTTTEETPFEPTPVLPPQT